MTTSQTHAMHQRESFVVITHRLDSYQPFPTTVSTHNIICNSDLCMFFRLYGMTVKRWGVE